MDSPPIRDERVLEALEACRPGSADLSDPALAHLAAEMAVDPGLERLYERLQQVDARLAAAFPDVPVPAGLAERIAERLAVAAPPAEGAEVPGGRTEGEDRRAERGGRRAEVESESVALRPRRISRRWLLAGLTTLSAAACLLVAVWIGGINSKPYTASAVREQAIDFFANDEAAPGQLDAFPEDYPFSRDVERRDGTRWRTIRGFLGHTGVAYDLPAREGVRATLYVVDCDVEGLLGQPPSEPDANTADFWAAAWRDQGRVYVLVVQGTKADYRDFRKTPTGPV
jgi:hypothetical protein